MAARLAMGESLPLVRNSVTKTTTACFEPALDYVVTKIPRWDLAKFNNANHVLGSGMKSVGEVMAVGRSWEESLQKAIRMVDPANPGYEPREFEDLLESLTVPTQDLIYAICTGLESGKYDVERINEITNVDPWFLEKLQH